MQSGSGLGGYAAGGLMAGAGLGSMFGGNPYDAASKYYNKIPGIIGQYYNPYIQQGQDAYGGLNNASNQMMNNPGGFINGIGSQYQQSPGFKFALQQALQGSNQGAAAGGLAGSPQNQQQNMGIATNMANQDYYNWLNTALGQQNMGMGVQQGFYNGGMNAGMRAGEDLASTAAQQGNLAYMGQQQQDQGLGAFLGGLGSIAGTYFGGPVGGAVGGAVGRGIGS